MQAGNAYSKVRINYPGWWESIKTDASLDSGLGGIADDTILGTTALDQVSEVARAIETYNNLRMLGVTNLEYDDWLRSFGVSIAAPVDDRPELLRYTREWQYPSNAVSVDATAQRVSSVLSWTIRERADKDRFFKEPGVVLGLCVARPKLFHNKAEAGIGKLKTAIAWQTPLIGGGFQSYQPVVGMTGYQFDTLDLLNHGDQFRFATRGSLPTGCTFTWPANGVFGYMTDADINALFVDGASGYVKLDGVATFSVATHAVGPDATPATV